MAQDRGTHWRTRPVTIKFKHLNPALQGIIGRGGVFNPEQSTIRGRRHMRFLFEVVGLNLLFEMITALSLVPRKPLLSAEGRKMMGLAAGGVLLASSLRLWLAKTIQRKHKQLAKSMKEVGILQPRFEGNYPRDWINPTVVANTHPTFYVKRNGDLVFLRNNRLEYARYLFQKGFPGKIGLNLWRWRGYLEPPEAPQPIREWARAKALEWAGTLVPKTKPAFGTARAIKALYAAKKRRRRTV